MPTSLAFSDVRRSFGRLRVLAGVSGAVGAGKVLLVTGSNGAGKSTLLKCLAGLLAPEGGSIDYRENGESLDIAGRRRRSGLVAPDVAFYDDLTVEENLTFFAQLRGLPAATGAAWAKRVSLPPDRPAGALSSGMRQRLRWAFALLGEPRMLLLDEPFQNLDASGEALGRELLAEHLTRGLAVVASPTAVVFPNLEQHLAL